MNFSYRSIASLHPFLFRLCYDGQLQMDKTERSFSRTWQKIDSLRRATLQLIYIYLLQATLSIKMFDVYLICLCTCWSTRYVETVCSSYSIYYCPNKALACLCIVNDFENSMAICRSKAFLFVLFSLINRTNRVYFYLFICCN